MNKKQNKYDNLLLKTIHKIYGKKNKTNRTFIINTPTKLQINNIQIKITTKPLTEYIQSTTKQ